MFYTTTELNWRKTWNLNDRKQLSVVLTTTITRNPVELMKHRVVYREIIVTCKIVFFGFHGKKYNFSLTMLISLFLLLFIHYCVKATVIVAARCSDGIVIGADSLTVGGAGNSLNAINHHSRVVVGNLISHRHTNKFFPISQDCCLCYVRGESEFQRLLTDVKSVDLSRQFLPSRRLSVAETAKYCRLLINKKYPSVHIILVGKRKENYEIWEVLPKGTLVRHEDFAVSGSGSECITALLHDFYLKKEDNLEVLSSRVRDALKLAVSLDHKSGGHLQVKVLR